MNKFLLIFTLTIGMFFQVNAQTVTWLGGAGDWTDATKWDTGVVPTAGDEVIIDKNDAIVSFLGSTTIGRLSVSNDAQLTIEVASVMMIVSTATRALETSPSGVITNNGSITVSTTGGEGIYNKGPFTNNGNIGVSGTSSNGIRLSSGTFTNSATGIIAVTNSGSDYIYADDSSTIPSTFENNGSITIVVTTGDDGIYVNDGSIFNNAGTIDISLGVGATGGDEAIYAEDGGTFNNNSGGVITISSSKDHGMAATTGGVLNNNMGGTINIDAVTDDQFFLDNAATGSNAGTINLTNGSDIGLYVTDSSEFTNEATGEINVTNATDHSVYVDANGSGTANLINSGTITANGGGGSSDGLRVGEGGTLTNNPGGVLMYNTPGDEGIEVEPASTLTNNGTINIPGAGDHGIENKGDIINGGTITIGTITDDQLFLDANSTLINSGTITLTDAPDYALIITDASVFTNMAAGEVNITDAGDNNIHIDANLNASPATLNNFGTITSTGGAATFDGLRVQDNGIVNNNAGASFFFVSNLDEAILVETGSVFNNSGTVDITNAADHGMELIGTFNNMDGGLYKAANVTDDGIRVNGGTFNNDGDIRIDGSGSEDIEVDSDGTFTNSATATFAPGSSPGDLEIRNVFDLGSSTTTFEINGTTEVTEFDQILNANGTGITSTLTISSATAHLDWGAFVPTVGDCFKIVDGSGPVAGTFASVTTSNAAIVLDPITYNGTEVEICVMAILPVDLTYFKGETQNTANILAWQTQTEENNDYFEVQYSTNGREFSKVGIVQGNGTTNEVQNYDYTHKDVRSVDNYYRLKQVDFDGDFEYSDIIYLQNDRSDTPVAIYPNPARESITYDGEAASLTFFDIQGRQVMQQAGNERTTIDISTLKSGVYTIEILTNTGNRTFEKLIKE